MPFSGFGSRHAASRQAFGNVSSANNRAIAANHVPLKAHAPAQPMATDFTEGHSAMEMPVATDFENEIVMHNIPVMSMDAPTKAQTSHVVEVKFPSGETRVMARKDAEAAGATPTGQLVAVSSSQINFARTVNPSIPMIPSGSEQIVEAWQMADHGMGHPQEHMMMQQQEHMMMQQQEHMMMQPHEHMMMQQEQMHPEMMHHHHHHQPQPHQQFVVRQPQIQMVPAHHGQQQVHHVQVPQHPHQQPQHVQLRVLRPQAQPQAQAQQQMHVQQQQPQKQFDAAYWQQAVDRQIDTALRREQVHKQAHVQPAAVSAQNVYDFADKDYYQRQMPGYQLTGVECSL